MELIAMYDAVVLGTGHHGLIFQAYLGRAGLKTVSVDVRPCAGGALTTVEHPTGSGFRHNTHAFYHRGATSLPWYKDLELERHGAVYIEPECNVCAIGPCGEVLSWWTDFEKTAAAFERFSSRDADRLRYWRDAFRPIARDILIPESQSPPLPSKLRRELLEGFESGRQLLETSRLSPLEFVTREFEHPLVQAGLLFFNGLREVDLRQPGFGHHIPYLLASDRMAQMSLGGASRLAESLVRAVEETGGEIKTGVEVRQILVENGRVIGVDTSDGEIRAKRLVASSLNPQQTFLELLDDRYVPHVWRERARNFRYNLLAPLFGVYVNLHEPPRYQAAERHPELNDALMVIVGLESVETFHEIVSAHEGGRIPRPRVMWGSCPSQFDPSQAPANSHTAFMWEKLPYALDGDPKRWIAERDVHARRMLDDWSRWAPNLTDATIEWFAKSPLEVERSFPNMRQGDLLIGAFTNDQVGFHRPFVGAGEYRGHLPGLYLCGSSCHPGGNITGLAGYNAAQVALADLGIRLDGFPPPLADRWRRHSS